VGTVSNYLNNKTVSPKLSERIKAAIDTLGFTSNMLAKGMRMQRSSVIGLCLPYTSLTNFSTMIDALDRNISSTNYEMMQVLSRQDETIELQRVKKLAAFRMAGLLLVPSLRPQAILDYLDNARIPTVLLGRYVPDEHRFDQVAVDHSQAMYEASKALIERGHGTILFILRFPTLVVTLSRIAALERAIADSGRNVVLQTMTAPDDEATFTEVLSAQMSAAPPSAIIVSNELMSSWTVKILLGRGLQLERDIAVSSLQKPQWADLLSPGVSYVEQPTVELADRVWHALHRRMLAPDADIVHDLLPVKLVMARASTRS
jgi:LacI family transcriptional regulator